MLGTELHATKVDTTDGPEAPAPDLGLGFKSISSEIVAPSMDTAHVLVGADAAQDVSYRLLEVQSRTALRRTLQLSASASFGGVGWNASASIDVFQQSDYNLYHNYLLVIVDVLNSPDRLTEYVLRQDAERLLAQGNTEEFYRRYGDGFIAQVITGGSFYALFDYTAESSSEQRAISVKLQGASGSFSMSASFQQSFQSLSELRVTRIQVKRAGAPPSDLPDGGHLMEAALRFPTQVRRGVVREIVVKSYDLATNRPVGRRVNVSQQMDFIQSLAGDRDLAETYRVGIGQAIATPGLFETSDRAVLDRKLAAVDSVIADIDRQARQLFDNPIPITEIRRPTFQEILPLPQLRSGVRPPLRVLVHLEGIGDMTFGAADWAGTKGQFRRLEGIQLSFSPALIMLGIEYMAHVEGQGDTSWVSDGQFCGTRGQSLRLEGFATRLKGAFKDSFDVFYQAHLEGRGDTSTFSNGEFCGTRGESRRVEAMRVWVQAKA